MRYAVLAAALVVAAPAQALAWGAMGHRIIGEVAVESLPAEIPGFLRTPEAAAWAGELAREPDRSKGAGKTHDHDRDAAHFIDLDDDGRVLGGPTLAELPVTRADYEKALQAAGTDSWKAGYLSYSIISGWQQLVRDFALWRILAAGEKFAADPERRAWYAEDRRRREALILGDLGYLAHMTGDGAQPLHVSVHYNGWGDGPNPRGFTTARIHGAFEGAFVKANITPAAVRAVLPAPAPCACPIDQRVRTYIGATYALVVPLYQLEKDGALKDADPRGVAFATERLAAGAAELRDQITMAWTASATAKAGWPEISVADVEAGKVEPFDALYGAD